MGAKIITTLVRATIAKLGIVKLSVAPVDATQPIAVGDNDSRLHDLSTTMPQMDGTGAVGSSAAGAHGDHQHPSDTSRQAHSSTLDTLSTAPSPSPAGTYGDAGHTVTFIVDAQGRVTGVTENAISSGYSLPTASASTLGGVKVGSGLAIDPATGVLSATGGGGTVPTMTLGQILGAAWTADNLGSLSAAQAGTTVTFTVTDGATALHGYTIPMPTLPIRIRFKIGCNTGNTYTTMGVGLKSSGGAIKIFNCQAWAAGIAEISTWASTTSYSGTNTYTVGFGSSTMILAVDIDASGNIKFYSWINGSWVQMASAAMGYVPTLLGIYLKGQNGSSAVGVIYWIDSVTYGANDPPVYGA